MEIGLSIAIHLAVYAFFGWCVWVTNPKRPERLVKLRARCSPRD